MMATVDQSSHESSSMMEEIGERRKHEATTTNGNNVKKAVIRNFKLSSPKATHTNAVVFYRITQISN
jgi:hypothetical protein